MKPIVLVSDSAYGETTLEWDAENFRINFYGAQLILDAGEANRLKEMIDMFIEEFDPETGEDKK